MRILLLLLSAAVAMIVAVWHLRPIESDPVLRHVPLAATALVHFDELDALQRAHRPAAQFWMSNAEAEVARIEKTLSSAKAARAALVARFGERIRDSSMFWQLFRPLHSRMPDLTSEQQIALHELEQQFAARTHRNGTPARFSEHLKTIRNSLGARIAAEYALRSSPLADELRQVDFEFSEADFRTAFAALSELSGAGDHAAFLAARESLRNSLGSRNFAQLWSRRDPRFADVKLAAGRLGLTEDVTLTAYTLILENEDAMLAAVGPSGDIEKSAVIREQYRTGRRRLQAVVGEHAADMLLHAAAGNLRQGRLLVDAGN